MVSAARMFVLAVALASVASATKVTPLGKVTQMMQDMIAKGKEAKHVEETEFAKFHAWCDSTRAETTRNIADGADKILQLNSDIVKADADAETLTAEIADLEASVAAQTKELDAATVIRKKEKADYKAAHLDFSESISAIERAVDVLKARTADVPQSLLQVQKSPLIPAQAKSAIASLLAVAQSDLADESAPEANAYENQSGGVIGLLEKLLRKFTEQRLTLEKAEMSANGDYEVLKQQLTDNIKEANSDISDKTKAKAQRRADSATATGDLETTTASKAADESTLADTNSECRIRSEEFEKNQVVRSDEIHAIEKAVEILSSDAVKGNAETHLPAALAQTGTALAHFRSQARTEPELRQKLAEFLQAKAKKLGSRYLALVASKALDDPFAKVKKMIKDMIVKLMEEANSEADAKAFCDTEMATNKMTRDNKASEVEELTANIEVNSANIAQLASEVAELSDAIAATKASVAGATSIRGEEKATNTKTVADAKEAQAAVSQATQVLKDFYDSQASGSALLQGGGGIKQAMDQAAKAPYKGMGAESGGIMGMLEVVLSDFARLETETSAAEDMAQRAYDKFMDESTFDNALKETEVEHKSNKKQDTEAANVNLKKELDLTQAELDEALGYFEKLKPDCVDQKFSYEDRVKQREEEIESLKEALKVLAGEDLA